MMSKYYKTWRIQLVVKTPLVRPQDIQTKAGLIQNHLAVNLYNFY